MKRNIDLIKLNKSLIKSFKKLNINKSQNVFIASDLSCLRKLRIPKKDLLDLIYKSIKFSLPKKSTIFVPTGNIDLCNKDFVFDIKETPSKDMGSFSEFIRKKKKTVRSLHPLWSVSANGENSKLLNNVSKHSYGIGSPWSLMLDLDTVQINIGKHPSKAVTLIHHIETIFGVPYRYNKQFLKKIKVNNKIIISDFYMSVFFKKINAEKKIKLNEHYFNKLKKNKKLNHTINEYGLEVWSFKMRDFYSIAIQEMKADIFNYLEKKPRLDLIKMY